MPYVSEEEEKRVLHYESKMARAKAEAKAVGAKVVGLATAGAVGFAVGMVNTKYGGTPQAPYAVSGVPIDLGIAALSTLGLLLARKSSMLPVAAGAAFGSMALVGARYGAQYEPQLLGAGSASTSTTNSSAASTASNTSTPSTSTSGVGYMNLGKNPRLGRPGGAYGVARNPYLASYGAR